MFCLFVALKAMHELVKGAFVETFHFHKVHRFKSAEAAKAAAEKTAADAQAAQQAAEKATAEANGKVANIASKYNALNGKLEEVQKQLTKAEARADKAEERADKMLEKALAATANKPKRQPKKPTTPKQRRTSKPPSR